MFSSDRTIIVTDPQGWARFAVVVVPAFLVRTVTRMVANLHRQGCTVSIHRVAVENPKEKSVGPEDVVVCVVDNNRPVPGTPSPVHGMVDVHPSAMVRCVVVAVVCVQGKGSVMTVELVVDRHESAGAGGRKDRIHMEGRATTITTTITTTGDGVIVIVVVVVVGGGGGGDGAVAP